MPEAKESLTGLHREDGPAGEWPLRSFLELGALPSAVPCARLHARLLMREWGRPELAENVEILVSELVTNAVHATRSLKLTCPVRLWLLSEKARVLVLVHDAGPRSPVRVDASGEAETGRGLLLVEALSATWDWYFTRETGGKVVWALIGAELP
jgi:anti-sigma regulatory factor (Ser/Thr protein kinase)